MKIRCIWEHNGNDSLLYAENFAGAFARGENLEAAKGKMEQEISSYLNWTGETGRLSPLAIEIVQEKSSELAICDADSDVLFDREREPLSMEEYMALKHLVLKSAQDFHALYMSVPDRNRSCIPARRTFYGDIPRTAEEMYRHTKSVNAYYFAEIGVDADNDGTIYECRERGFDQLEQIPDFLQNKVYIGSYDEAWSLRKVMRRFLWHDRIHAKAMYRMAFKTFGKNAVLNIFHFSV